MSSGDGPEKDFRRTALRTRRRRKKTIRGKTMTNQQTTAPDEKKESRVAQIVLSVLILAGFAVFLFVPNAALADAGLYRQIFDTFRQPSDIQFLNIAYYSFTGFYALLLIFTVISFFVKKKAAFALNCIKTLAGVVVFVFFIYVCVAETGATLNGMFKDDKTYVDLNSTFLSLVFGLIMIFVLSLSYYKGRGVVKCVGGLIALAYASMLFYDRAFIGGRTLIEFFDLGFTYGEGALASVISYAFIALAYAAAANAALALLALAVRRMSVLDLIRSIVMFLLSAVCFVFFIVEDSFSQIGDHLGIVVFLGLSVIQLIYAVIVFAAAVSKKAKKAEEPVYEIGPDNQMAFQGYAQPAPAAAETAAEPAAQAAQPVSEEAARVNAAFDDAAQISIEDIVAQNSEAEDSAESSYDGAIRDEAPAKEEIEEEKEFDFEQKQHDGQFNREYTDYQAAEEARRQQAAAQAAQAAQQYAAPNAQQAPYAGGIPYGYGAGYAQQYAQNAPGYYGGPIPYLPDAFINSLTPAERDEFDKLFISRIYGENKRLPVYTVGADNREFFAKVFVFMGRYRTIISEGLLEKIYNYSNSIR